MMKKTLKKKMILNICFYLFHLSFAIFSWFEILVLNNLIFIVSLVFSFVFALYHLIQMLHIKWAIKNLIR